eukprot:snap_masked-scaffold_6-processed-gene-12.23-mRNA-1 protein AED:0.16 eAED:0.17 QI:0/-1/0/1/-1/1/1/0/383
MENREDIEERLHFQEVLISFKEYELDMFPEIDRRSKVFRRLLVDSGKISEEVWGEKFNRQRRCVKENQEFLRKIIAGYSSLNEEYILGQLTVDLRALKKKDLVLDIPSADEVVPGNKNYSSATNSSKIRAILHQIAREWSSEGQEERNESFEPILSYLSKAKELLNKRILIPGTGLGRMIYEVANKTKGFVEGNDFSYQMILVAEFFLNKTSMPEEFSIYPWIDTPCNKISNASMCRKIKVPDVILDNKLRISFRAGEFLRIYTKASTFDIIITCFFLDTAPDVTEYIQKIKFLLKPGGIWINHGPLFYHWYEPNFSNRRPAGVDERSKDSVELSLEEILHYSETIGFSLIEKKFYACGYCFDKESLMNTKYKTCFFVAQKGS